MWVTSNRLARLMRFIRIRQLSMWRLFWEPPISWKVLFEKILWKSDPRKSRCSCSYLFHSAARRRAQGNLKSRAMIVRLARWCTSLALLMLFAAVVSGQSILPSQSDTQSWNDVNFSVALNKAFDFAVLGTL